ncbi:NAD(P)/FAD-dependent oxidoreductase [Nocardioides okcheonensis]|uniref:NAD(P)/FAD-dependent oxidoreductase n=1 Tax=Nocardioides okcheonensis TaxID=2894081 RepID=UPI001E5E2A03|nr:FAD-dependent oxidoreductase [Nocardioides okcheonensis]UFN45172.1 FAD-dependent oxidoreductase [Nocardioides okcheonensis]
MTTPAPVIGRAVIVGASLAGLRAAAALRANGFEGDLTVIGAEPHPPYDRPPLSKRLLRHQVATPFGHSTGPAAADGDPAVDPAAWGVALPVDPSLDIRWQLGSAAVGLDPRERMVHTVDGRQTPYDALIIATGARARRWGGPGASLAGLVRLRSLEDAVTLRHRLFDAAATGGQVLVVGGGFIGVEVSVAARALGCAVTVIEQQSHLLSGQIGELAGQVIATKLHDLGIGVRLGRRLLGFGGDADDRLRVAHLDDGSTLDAHTAVIGLGVVPATEWLRGTDAVLRPALSCDQHCMVHGLPTETPIAAAGDVARWPSPVFDQQQIEVGHWSNAREQGEVAAHNLLVAPEQRRPYVQVPTFWSDIADLRLRSVGLPALGDDVTVVSGSIASGRVLLSYTRRGRQVGAISINQPAQLPAYHRMIAEHAQLDLLA